MRKQIITSKMQRQKNLMLLGLLIFLILIAIICISIGKFREIFTPPDKEIHAIKGTVQAENSYMYGELDAPTGYRFGLAANLYQQEDGSVNIYFSNSEKNTQILLCQIYDAADQTLLYESGLLYPGEYVENLKPKVAFANAKKDINIKVCAFEPETWYSAGTAELTAILQPW